MRIKNRVDRKGLSFLQTEKILGIGYKSDTRDKAGLLSYADIPCIAYDKQSSGSQASVVWVLHIWRKCF